MSEAFLHYIWQFQYFDRTDLATADGERVEVIQPGFLNTHAGPDFASAKIRIGGMDWAGSVEIHVRASEWFEHHHDQDPAYEQVVLHVVWLNDRPVHRLDRTPIPVVAMMGRVGESLMQRYLKLVNNPATIPCKRTFPDVPEVIRYSMLDKALVQRLETKASLILEWHRRNRNDWQETAYQVLARNFGFKVNSDPFLDLARMLPHKILLKHADQPVQVEALLFGQAGLLETEVGDEYYRLLQREYAVLGTKYSLRNKRLSRARWRFLRLRPANFPTLRIAQLAALVSRRRNLFSGLVESTNYAEWFSHFSVVQSRYWQSHYRFNIEVEQPVPGLGDDGINNLLINSVAPLVAAYGKFTDQVSMLEDVLSLLQRVPAESNAILRKWSDLGCFARSAHDSQALIELHNHFCQQRKCLNCAIGTAILKPDP